MRERGACFITDTHHFKRFQRSGVKTTQLNTQMTVVSVEEENTSVITEINDNTSVCTLSFIRNNDKDFYVKGNDRDGRSSASIKGRDKSL